MMIKNETPAQIATKFFQMCYEADPPAQGPHKIQSVYDSASQTFVDKKKSFWTLTLANQGRVQAVFKSVG